MPNKLQKHIRTTYYHLPIYCGFCGHMVLNSDLDGEPKVSPCKHTLYIAHQEGYEYLSDRAKEQLEAKGFSIQDEDGFIQVISKDDEEELDRYELHETLSFPDGLEVEAIVGPPSGFSTYVGLAPLDDE